MFRWNNTTAYQILINHFVVLLLSIIFLGGCSSADILVTQPSEITKIAPSTVTDHTREPPPIVQKFEVTADVPKINTIIPTLEISNAEFTAEQNQFVMICSPLENHPLKRLSEIVSDPYNPPPDGKDGRHMGVDFSYYHWNGKDGIEGTQVASIFSGNVSAALISNNIPYGYAVIIETPTKILSEELLKKIGGTIQESIYTMYAHLLEAPVLTNGDEIDCGDVLGFVGQTGGEDTPYAVPHLHVEMRLGPSGMMLTEMGFYDTRLTEDARKTYLRWRTSGEFRHIDPMLILDSE